MACFGGEQGNFLAYPSTEFLNLECVSGPEGPPFLQEIARVWRLIVSLADEGQPGRVFTADR